MIEVALRMLSGDRTKYLGLISGIAFATLLITQQASIFVSLMMRSANQVLDVREADVWVMDPRVRYVDEVEPLRDVDLTRIRGVEGIEWAVPFYKGAAILRTREGLINQISLVGVDDATLAGAPRKWVKGDLSALRRPYGIVFDVQGAEFIWPGEDVPLGRTAEINDVRVEVTGLADVAPPFITFPIAYMRYSDAVRLLPPERNVMSYVIVKAAPGVDPAVLAKRITEQTSLQALTWDAFAWRSVEYVLTRTGIPVNFGITVLLGILVGAAVTAQTFYLFVFENLRQFGALKAIGATNVQILRMVLAQAAVVGTLGYGIGVGLCALFFHVTSGAAALEAFRMVPEVVAATGGVIAMILVLSCLFSIRRVFVVDPAIVFRG